MKIMKMNYDHKQKPLTDNQIFFDDGVKREKSYFTAGSTRQTYRSPVHNSSGCFKHGKNWDREGWPSK